MSVYIISTTTSGRKYREMSKPKLGKDGKWTSPPKVVRSVDINGGANVSPGVGIMTPRGVATRISDEDYTWLKEESSFKRHLEKGFLSVVKSDKEVNANAVAGSMKEYDGSAPQNVDSGNATLLPQKTAEG